MTKFLPAFFATIGVVQSTSMTADSAAGQRLLKKAVVVESSKYERALDGEGGYYPNLSSMTIKYVGCSRYEQYGNGNSARNNYYNGNGQGQYQQNQYQQNQNGQQKQNGQQNQNGQNQWYEYQQQARNDGLEMSNLVRFTLCPGSNCAGQCSGEYVISMEEFIEEYLDWKMDYENFWCERVREGCVCNNNYSWKDCYSSCFEQKGLSYDTCMSGNNNNKNNGNNVFQIQQYLECTGIKFYNPDWMYRSSYGNYNNGGNYNNYGNFNWQNYYYLGLTCESNDVVLKAFYDEDCSYRADESAVQDAMGDYTNIPYLKGTPVLARNTCLPCIDAETEVEQQQKQYQNNQAAANNYNQQQQQYYWQDDWEEQPDATDLCNMITNANGDSSAIVCDQFNQMGCYWIQNTLPSLDGRVGFDYAAKLASVKDQLVRSERLQWALLSLVLLLFFTLAGLVGYYCASGRREGPRNRAALLEYRREDSRLNALSASGSNLA